MNRFLKNLGNVISQCVIKCPEGKITWNTAVKVFSIRGFIFFDPSNLVATSQHAQVSCR